MLGGRLYLPDNQGIKKAFLNAQAFYGRNNALSIGHSRDSEGHSDEADAIATAVFEITGKGDPGMTEQDWKNFVDMNEKLSRMPGIRRPSSYEPEDAPEYLFDDL
ncbi:hypothetical protein ES705_39375 [subsurface metagenome]